jgi:hypothetical protein
MVAQAAGLWRHVSMCVVALAASLLIGVATRAQHDEVDDEDPQWRSGPQRPEDNYPPQITRGDVLSMVRLTGMSDAQREAALELHAGYAERHVAAARKLAEFLMTLRADEVVSQEELQEIDKHRDETFSAFWKRGEDLATELRSDIDSLLSPEQERYRGWLERLSRVNNNRRLLFGEFGGDIDLVSTLEGIGRRVALPPEARDVAERHLVALGAIALQAETEEKGYEAQINALFADPNLSDEEKNDRARLLEPKRRPNAARAFIATRRAVEELKGLLGEDEGLRLEAALYREPDRGYGPPLILMFDRAARLAELSDDARARILHERARFMREQVERERKRAEDVLRRIQSGENRKKFDWSTEYKELMARRDGVINFLRSVLSLEQRRALGPPIPEHRVPRLDLSADGDLTTSGPKLEKRPEWLGPPSRPVVSESDLRALSHEAGLSAEQEEAAKELLETYVARLLAANDAMERFAVALYPDGYPLTSAEGTACNRAWIQATTKFESQVRRLAGEFVKDLRDLLDEKQRPAVADVAASVELNLAHTSALVKETTSIGAGVDLGGLVRWAFAGEPLPQEVREVLSRHLGVIGPVASTLLELDDDRSRELSQSAERADFEWGDDAYWKAALKHTSEANALLSQARKDALTAFKQVLPMIPEERRLEFEASFYRQAAACDKLDSHRQSNDPFYKVDPLALADEIQRLPNLAPEQMSAVRQHKERLLKQSRDHCKAMYEKLESLDAQAMAAGESVSIHEVISMDYQQQIVTRNAYGDLMKILTSEQKAALPLGLRPRGQLVKIVFGDE